MAEPEQFSTPFDWIDDELRQLEESNLLRTRVIRSGELAASIVVDGQRYLNFGSNDYLGLAADPELKAAIEQAVRRGGWGSGASPLIVGRSAVHAELERRLATFMGCEAALLFATGFAANCGTIAALVGKGDIIFSDEKNHASIIDGCRLSRARIVVYRHRDMRQLESALTKEKSAARKLVVTDGLFSMDGDVAPLPDLVELAEQHGAMLLVDEAHALGMVGRDGRGTAAQFDLSPRVPLRVATLSKALGGHGGFVVGRRSVIDYLANCARSYVFSTAPTTAAAAAGLVALRLLRDQPHRRERLIRAAAHVRQSLSDQGWDIGTSESQIVPILVGDETSALDLAERVRAEGLWVPCIRPPSIPRGQSRLRISLTSEHSDAMIERLLATFEKLRAQ